MAPIGLSQCSSPLSPELPSVPAGPLTTLPPCPCLGCVMPCATAGGDARTKHTAVTMAQRSPVTNIAVLQRELTDVSGGMGFFITSAGCGFVKFEDRRSIGPLDSIANVPG